MSSLQVGPGVEELLKKGQLEKIPPEVLEDILEAQASGRTLVSAETGRAFTIEGAPFYEKSAAILSTPRTRRTAPTSRQALQVGPGVERILRAEEYAVLPQKALEEVVEAQYYGRPIVAEVTAPTMVSKTPVLQESEAVEVKGRGPVAEEQPFTYVGSPYSPSYWPTLPNMAYEPAEVADYRAVRPSLFTTEIFTMRRAERPVAGEVPATAGPLLASIYSVPIKSEVFTLHRAGKPVTGEVPTLEGSPLTVAYAPITPLQEWGARTGRILSPVTGPVAGVAAGLYEGIRINVYGGAPWGSWRKTTLTGQLLDVKTPLEDIYKSFLLPAPIVSKPELEREQRKIFEPIETTKATVAASVGGFEVYLRPDIPTVPGYVFTSAAGAFSKEYEIAARQTAAELRELGPGYIVGSLSAEILQTILLSKAASKVFEKAAATETGKKVFTKIGEHIPERVKKLFTRESPVLEIAEETQELTREGPALTTKTMTVAQPGVSLEAATEGAGDVLTPSKLSEILKKMGSEIQVDVDVQKTLFTKAWFEADWETRITLEGMYVPTEIAEKTLVLKGPAAKMFKDSLFEYLLTTGESEAPGGVGLLIKAGSHPAGSLESISSSASVLLQEAALKAALKTSLKLVTEPSVVPGALGATAVKGASQAASLLERPKTKKKTIPEPETRQVFSPVLEGAELLQVQRTPTMMQAWTGKPYPGVQRVRAREELEYAFYTMPGQVQRLVVNTTPVVDIAQKTTPITDIALKTTPVTETVQKVTSVTETILKTTPILETFQKVTPITETLLKTTPIQTVIQTPIQTSMQIQTPIQTQIQTPIQTPVLIQTPLTITPPKTVPPPIPPWLLPTFPEDRDLRRACSRSRGWKWMIRNPIAEPGEVADYILGKSKKGRRRQRELPITMSGGVVQHIVGLHSSPNPVKKVLRVAENRERAREASTAKVMRRSVLLSPSVKRSLLIQQRRIVQPSPVFRKTQVQAVKTVRRAEKGKIQQKTRGRSEQREKPRDGSVAYHIFS